MDESTLAVTEINKLVDCQEAVSGVEVRNGNGHNINNLCDSDIVDIYEQNQISNHLEIGSSSTMVLSPQNNNFYASERFKVLLAFLILIFCFFVSTIALIFAHNRLPDRDPLPDLVLDQFSSVDMLLYVTEVQIIVVVNICICTIFFHKKRLVLAKRSFLLLSLLYVYRAITMSVTVLPIASRTYYCSPKKSNKFADVIFRALSVFSGMGLSINGQQNYCGDSIYSGHTTILFFAYLILNEYLPKKFFLLKKLALLNAILGSLFLLMSHSHYTIDVVIAYYITTRLFWSYHNSLTNYNSSSPEWWFPIFKYFEKNSARNFSNEFEVPWTSLKRHSEESQI